MIARRHVPAMTCDHHRNPEARTRENCEITCRIDAVAMDNVEAELLMQPCKPALIPFDEPAGGYEPWMPDDGIRQVIVACDIWGARRRSEHHTFVSCAAKAARKRIEQIVSDVEPGRIYEGKVAKLMDFGAFVTIMPGKDGLVHVSQISSERVEKVSDKLKEGDIVKVKVLEVDKQGRIRLSMKAVTEEESAAS